MYHVAYNVMYYTLFLYITIYHMYVYTSRIYYINTIHYGSERGGGTDKSRIHHMPIFKWRLSAGIGWGGGGTVFNNTRHLGDQRNVFALR